VSLAMVHEEEVGGSLVYRSCAAWMMTGTTLTAPSKFRTTLPALYQPPASSILMMGTRSARRTLAPPLGRVGTL
jgi:hypothetical protein